MKNVKYKKLKVIEGLLGTLKEDELFQSDLKDTEVKAALMHWTNKKRLNRDEAEKRFEENYRVQSVLGKIAQLQQAYRQAGLGVNLEAVLAGSTDPLYGLKKPKQNEENSNIMEDKKVIKQDIPIVEEEKTKENGEKEKEEEISITRESKSWLELTFSNIAIWWSVQIVIVAVISQVLIIST